MRNVWKGLIVGGLTGVAAGVVLDSVAGATRKAAAIGGQVREHAPEAGRWVHSVSDRAGEWLHDAEVPDHVRGVAHKLKDSDAGSKVAGIGNDILTAAKDAATAHTS
jgi:hypothetical protein